MNNHLDNDDVLLELFYKVYGKVSDSCYLQTDTYNRCVDVMKDGHICWSAYQIDMNSAILLGKVISKPYTGF